MDNNNQNIVIISGSGLPAISALNIYANSLTDEFNLYIIEEKNITLKKIISFVKKRIKKVGMIRLIDFLLLKIVKIFVFKEKQIIKCYSEHLSVDKINSRNVLSFIKEKEPFIVITNGCSILQADLINGICSTGSKIINLHNGITPKYRGAGNFWAFYEKNYDLIGTTIHLLDEGIDTGHRIATIKIDFRKAHFREIDRIAFEEGAKAIVRYIQTGEGTVHEEYRNLRSNYYSYPGLSEFIIARRNFQDYKLKRKNIETEWQKYFKELAQSDDKSYYQKMEWADEKSIIKRDALVERIFKKTHSSNPSILDVGCGDGRYHETLIPNEWYVGCDYSIDILKMRNTGSFKKQDLSHLTFTNSLIENKKTIHNEKCLYVESDATVLPFKTDSFDFVCAVGLFQHLDNAQIVADELFRVTKKEGQIVINTLRQFSNLELILILLGSLFDKNRFLLALAIYRKDYGKLHRIAGTYIARRYEVKEIQDLFKISKKDIQKFYGGLWGTRLFSREMTVLLKK